MRALGGAGRGGPTRYLRRRAASAASVPDDSLDDDDDDGPSGAAVSSANREASTCGKAPASVEAIAEATTMYVCPAQQCQRAYPSEYSLQEHQRLRGHRPAAPSSASPSPPRQ
eukprot:m51a1_g11344 hypothetical protein (113) ;mRNA; r:165634-166430